MNKRFKCSNAAMVAAGVGLLALVSTSVLHLRTNRIIDQRRSESKAAEGALLSEIAARDGCTEIKLHALAAEVGRFGARLGDAEASTRLSAEFDDKWSREVGPRHEGREYAIQNYILRKDSPSAGDWPAILEAVKRAESIQGVSIAEFKMKIGDGPQPRSADFVSMNVEVRSHRSLTPSAAR